MNIFLDTAPLIYLVEGDFPRREKVRLQLQQWVESDSDLVASCITLMELLVHPKKNGDARLENQYRLYLERLLALPPVSVDERVAETAAAIRAQYGFKSPDALQLAAAVSCGCSVFYSNDRALRRFSDLDVILVDSE